MKIYSNLVESLQKSIFSVLSFVLLYSITCRYMHQNVTRVPHALRHLVFVVISLVMKKLVGNAYSALLAMSLFLHKKIWSGTVSWASM